MSGFLRIGDSPGLKKGLHIIGEIDGYDVGMFFLFLKTLLAEAADQRFSSLRTALAKSSWPSGERSTSSTVERIMS